MKWKNLRWLLGVVPLSLGAGCSGINTTQSVSPLDFLLPGSSKLLHMQNTPPRTLPNTNACIASLQLLPSPTGIPE